MRYIYYFENELLELKRAEYSANNATAFFLIDENGEEWGFITTNIPEYTNEITIAIDKNYIMVFPDLYNQIINDICNFQMYEIGNGYEAYVLYTLKLDALEISELDDRYKTIKQRRLDIVNEFNPQDKNFSYHTWIKSVNEIKTYPEALREDGYEDCPFDITPDFKQSDVEKALRCGTLIVYSSHEISDGVFVTPSKMEAQNYAGSETVYSKEVKLADIAWIDSIQGQYAKVDYTDAEIN